MPKDHYVAETYLKHFVGENKMLHVYRKSDGKYFPCHPNDICSELDGDLIKDFLSDPALLGKYRKIFEPKWNPAIAELQNGNLSQEGKMALAGYWGNLLVFTPARLRLDVKSRNESVMYHLQAVEALKMQAAKPDLKLKEMLEKFESGMYRIDTKPDAMRAMRVRHVMSLAWAFYNSHWIILKNKTHIDFLTSDNPVAFEDPGPLQNSQLSLPKYLPLTSKLCLYCDMKKRPKSEPYFSQPPKGIVRFATIEDRGVRRINRAVVQCAENLVISSHKHPYIEALVNKYSRYQIDSEFFKIQNQNSFIFVMRDRVRVVAGS